MIADDLNVLTHLVILCGFNSISKLKLNRQWKNANNCTNLKITAPIWNEVGDEDGQNNTAVLAIRSKTSYLCKLI